MNSTRERQNFNLLENYLKALTSSVLKTINKCLLIPGSLEEGLLHFALSDDLDGFLRLVSYF